MVLRIRLARFGKKHAPFYNIVVAHARTARQSPPLEVLGTYNPMPQPPKPSLSTSSTTTSSSSPTTTRGWKDIRLDLSRTRYWIGVGAQPSNTAWRLLAMVGILEPRFSVGQVVRRVVGRDGELVEEKGKAQDGGVRSGKSAAKSLVTEGVR